MTTDRPEQHAASISDARKRAAESARTDAARAEVKVAVEEWFTDVSLADLFDVKGWRR